MSSPKRRPASRNGPRRSRDPDKERERTDAPGQPATDQPSEPVPSLTPLKRDALKKLMVSVAARLGCQYGATEEAEVVAALTSWTFLTLVRWVGGNVPPISVKGRCAEQFHEEDPFPLGPFCTRTLINNRKEYVCDIVELPKSHDGDNVNRCLLSTHSPVELVSDPGPEAGQEAQGKSTPGAGGGAVHNYPPRANPNQGAPEKASAKTVGAATPRLQGGTSVRTLGPGEASGLVEEVAACFGPERDRVESILVLLSSACSSHLLCFTAPVPPAVQIGKQTLGQIRNEMAFDTDGEVIGVVIELPPAPGGNRKERRLIIYK